jgi:hypothetical protein
LKLFIVFKHSQKDVPNPEKQNHIFHQNKDKATKQDMKITLRQGKQRGQDL